jgi:hypothetical protein
MSGLFCRVFGTTNYTKHTKNQPVSSEPKNGVIRVGDAEFCWSVYRQPRWITDRGFLGLALLIEPTTESRRRLILEFDFDKSWHRAMPQHVRFRVPDKRLVQCIQSAIDAGYDPESRGKDFVFEAGSVNPS